MLATSDRRTDSLGEIASDRVYPLALFKKLTGLSDWALRQARRQGLRVHTQGRCRFIVGNDWLSHLQQQDG